MCCCVVFLSACAGKRAASIFLSMTFGRVPHMRYRHLLPVFFGLLTAGGVMTAPAVMAQSSTQQQAAISDDDLKTFAVAAKDVQRINQDYVPAYQAAKDDNQRTAIQTEAMGKMAQAVKDRGLSVDKYNQIVTAAQADPQIARKVDQYAKESQ